MFQTVHSFTTPETLVSYLEAGKDLVQFRRRAVLTRADDEGWVLVCCTVQGFPAEAPSLVTSRHYEHTILYEDRLSAQECQPFIEELEGGKASFGDIVLASSAKQQWELDLLPPENVYMKSAGRVARTRFAPKANWRMKGPLLAKDLPFYPDVTDAVRDWLPFTIYHGESDGRNQYIIFLLPEFRATFADAVFADGTLELTITGTGVENHSLLVKGSYWKDGAMTHFDCPLKAGKARIEVPNDAEQLAYVLLDSIGAVYDYQREDRFRDTDLGRRRLTIVDQGLEQQVRDAAFAGEGSQIEFKLFIDPDQSIGEKDKKTKLREVVTTVVAFANTQGGRIYVGIDDDCGVADIAGRLQTWAKADVTEQSIARYCGALRSVIRDWVLGDVQMRVSPARVDGALVVVVDVGHVAQAAKPVMLRGDNAFYVRAGASNRQLPADQWASVLGGAKQDAVFPKGF